MEVTVWGIKNLKKTETREFNHETGEYIKIPVKRCTGTIEFPVLADKAGKYEDQKLHILTEDEYKLLSGGQNGNLRELFDRIDSLGVLHLETAKIVKEMAEKESQDG